MRPRACQRPWRQYLDAEGRGLRSVRLHALDRDARPLELPLGVEFRQLRKLRLIVGNRSVLRLGACRFCLCPRLRLYLFQKSEQLTKMTFG